MSGRENRPEHAADLRTRDLEDLEALSPEDAWKALRDLRVHQMELEMQNEELRRLQEDLDKSRARYFNLYELAPVGYCTVSDKGLNGFGRMHSVPGKF